MTTGKEGREKESGVAGVQELQNGEHRNFATDSGVDSSAALQERCLGSFSLTTEN